MKFRPLCIDYHADAVSRLQEGARVVPQVVIYPVDDVVESSESECEEDVRQEKRTVLPPRFKAFKRSLSPLKDNASFEYMKQDPLQDMDCDQSKTDVRPLLPTGDSESEDDWQRKRLPPLPRGKDPKRSLPPVEDDISFDYMNHETLQDTNDVIDCHPLQDTDDELDPLQDTDDEMDRDEGKSEKRSLLSTRKPIVDVRVMLSYRHQAFSQHSKLGGGGNEGKSAKRSLLTTRTGKPIVDFEYAINMIENDILVASPREGDCTTKNERKKIEDIQKSITDDTEIDESFYMSLEQVPSSMENAVSFFLHAEESDSVDQRESSPPATHVRVTTPLDPQVLSRIVQGLRDSMSSKRIANVPEQLRAFYYGSAKDASVVFWRAGPVYGFAMNSSASFNDCMYGHDGIGHVLRHDEILSLSFPPTETVLGMLRNGNFHSMARYAPATASPTSNALLHAKPPFTVPPIWVDVVQAIMRATQISPAIVTPVITADIKRLGSHEFSDSLFIESLIGSKDTVPIANDGSTSNLKRPREETPLPEISPKRPKELFVEGEVHQKEKRKSRHGEKSDDDKMDRRERKRRKKDKKRARKERKRRANVHDAPLEDAVDARHESNRQEKVSQLNDPVHRFGVAAMSLQADTVDDSYEGHSDANAGSDANQWSNQLQANPVVQMPSHHSGAVSLADAPAFVERRTFARERKPETDKAILDAVLPALGALGVDDTNQDKKARKKHQRKEKKVRSTSKSSHVAEKKENGAPEIYEPLMPRVPASFRDEADASEGTTRLVRPTDRDTFRLPSKKAALMQTAERGIGNHQKTRPEPPDISSVAPLDTEDSPPVAPKVVPVPHDYRSGSQLHSEASTWASEAVPIHQDGRHSSSLENNGPPFRAICSESFLEGWNEATSRLASGQWLSSCKPLVPDEARATTDDEPPRLGQRIQLFDTPLLDDTGVDIELPGHAIIVYRLSSWQTSESANVHAKGVARLTALGRYERLDVIFYADVDISPALSLEIAFVQNSVVRQSRTHCRPPTFQVIAPRLLAAVVASSILSSQGPAIATDSFINGSITDVRVQERARFLLSICPLLTVCGALECLNMRLSGAPHDDDESRQSFQHLMAHTAMTACRRPVGNGKLVATNPSTFQQLSFAITVSSNNLLP